MRSDDRMDGAGTPPGPTSRGSSSGEPSFKDACAAIALAISAIDPQTGLRLRSAETHHLATCPACRRAVADVDPTALFAMLALESTQESFWTGFETRTLARIRELETRKQARWGWLQGRFRPLVAGSALVGVAAVMLVTYQLRHGTGLAPTHTNTGPPVAGARPNPPGAGGASVPMLPLQPDSAAAPSPIESVSSSTARVISIRVDASRPARSGAGTKPGTKDGTPAPSEESDVVLIVDQGIDI